MTPWKPQHVDMRPFLYCARLLLVGLLVHCFTSVSLYGQPPLPGTRPDAFYLKNRNGEPIFVPQVKYEEFERFLREKAISSSIAAPSAVLESIQVSGAFASGSGFVKVDIECTMVVTDAQSSWVRVPIALGNVNFTAPPKMKGGKSNFVSVDSNESQYLWWVEPNGSAKYSIEMTGMIKVNSLANDMSVRLELPEAATKIQLQLPSQNKNVQWIGANGEVLQTATNDKGLLAEVQGRGGVGTLVWNDRQELENIATTEVESVTRVVRISERTEYRANTRLKIKPDNRTGPRELVLILPRHSRWIPAPVTTVSSAWTLSISNDPRRLLLKIADRTRESSGEIPVEWAIDLPQESVSENSLPLSTIEIEGAQRHEGRLELVLPNAMRFTWQPSNDFTLLQQIPAPDYPQAIEYDFRFARQGASLRTSIQQEVSQMVFRPDYLVRIEKGFVRLDGVLNFTADPSQIFGLELIGGPWTIDYVTWDKGGQPIVTERAGNNTVRLSTASLVNSLDPVASRTVGGSPSTAIRIAASIPLATDKSQLKVELPLASWLEASGKRISQRGAGTLLIQSNSWQIVEDDTEISNLLKVTDPSAAIQNLIGSTNLGALLSYRFQATGPAPHWTTQLQTEPTVTSALLSTSSVIGEDSLQSRRTWNVTTTGPAIKKLRFQIPGTSYFTKDKLASSIGLQIDGRTVPFQVVELDKSVSPTETKEIEPIAASVKSSGDSTNGGDDEKGPQADPSVGRSPQNDTSENSDTTVGLTGNKVRNAELPNGNSAEFLAGGQPEKNESKPLLIEVLEEGSLPKSFSATVTTTQPFSLEENLELTQSLIQLNVEPAAIVVETPMELAVTSKDVLCEVPMKRGRQIRCTSLDGNVSFRLGEIDDYLTLKLKKLISLQAASVEVQDVWLQSVVNSKERRERCVMALTTNDKYLEFSLPNSWETSTLTVFIDGKRSNPTLDSTSKVFRLSLDEFAKSEKGRPTSSVPDVPTTKKYVIEFWNWIAGPSGLVSTVDANLPNVRNAVSTTPWVWQLVTSSDLHVWFISDSMSSNQSWTWKNLLGEPIVSRDQQSIERQLGATLQAALPANLNQFTFTSIRTINSTKDSSSWGTVQLVPRFLFWIPVAAVIVLVSMIGVMVPMARSPWIVSLVAVVVGVLALQSPELITLLIQSAWIACIIMVVHRSVAWALKRKVRRRTIFTNRPSTVAISRMPSRPATDEGGSTSPRSRIDMQGSNKAVAPRTLESVPVNSAPSTTAAATSEVE